MPLICYFLVSIYPNLKKKKVNIRSLLNDDLKHIQFPKGDLEVRCVFPAIHALLRSLPEARTARSPPCQASLTAPAKCQPVSTAEPHPNFLSFFLFFSSERGSHCGSAEWPWICNFLSPFSLRLCITTLDLLFLLKCKQFKNASFPLESRWTVLGKRYCLAVEHLLSMHKVLDCIITTWGWGGTRQESGQFLLTQIRWFSTYTQEFSRDVLQRVCVPYIRFDYLTHTRWWPYKQIWCLWKGTQYLSIFKIWTADHLLNILTLRSTKVNGGNFIYNYIHWN